MNVWKGIAGVLICALTLVSPAHAADSSIRILVDWSQTTGVSNTTPTVMVVPNPILGESSVVRNSAFAALKSLNAQHVRYLAWFAYPHFAVPALNPPSAGKTSWDFTKVDSMLIPFLESTKGRAPIISFSTIPAWMFKPPRRESYFDDPNKSDPVYGVRGTELIDASGRQLGEYHARLMRWYTQGGFTDENGKYHRSGYSYDLPWWGVLNEPGHEHFTTPQEYTRRYDAIVSAVRKVNPKTKFMSLSICGFQCDLDEGPEFFEYFLDPKNHLPGIPIDMISYHFYAHLRDGGSVAEWELVLFEKAEAFINEVLYINSIRQRLSPAAKVNIDELGLRVVRTDTSKPAAELPKIYWNMGAAYDSYLYLELAKRGVDVLTASHFIGSDDFTPSESMFDWRTGKGNARYHARKLLNDNFGSGDEFVATYVTGSKTRRVSQTFGFKQHEIHELLSTEMLGEKEVMAQGVRTDSGNRLILINKTMHVQEIDLTDIGRIVWVDMVDEDSGNDSARRETHLKSTLHLKPFAIAVLGLESATGVHPSS